jgi:hypothetical protein
MSRLGSTGRSFSANLPDLTGQTALVTIPVNVSRAHIWVENQSAGDLVVVGDVGDGREAWARILTGVGAGKQGADWSSDSFLGRLRVYGASGAQVSAGEF